MSFTYGSSTSALDQVRLMIFDTDSADALFSDEEINSQLSLLANDPVQVAIRLCQALASKFSRRAISKSAGKYSEDLTRIAEQYRAQAKMLQEQGGEPADSVAEQTFGDPGSAFTSDGENEFINRNYLRGED